MFSSVQFSCSVMSDSLWPHESQHARPPCSSPTPGVYSNSWPLSQWCHPAISSSVVPFSLLPPSPPSIRVLSNESTLCMRWPKYCTIHLLCYISVWCVCLCGFSCVWLCVTLWTVALQAPLSMGFSRQEYWNGLPCPPPGDLPDPGIKPVSLKSPASAGRFFTTSTTWETLSIWYSGVNAFWDI